MKAFIFILAFVYPNGHMDIHHTLVPVCPTQEEVKAIMKPLVDNKEVLLWGGSCTPVFKPLET